MTANQISGGSRLCLATVTTDSFVPGTLVMIYSFLKHNKGFTGDIVIICDELSVQSREFLSDLYEKISFLEVSEQLKDRVGRITRVFPEFAKKKARYYSIEAVRLSDYKKVLFCDSDFLFRRSIEDLFELPNPLIACGDGFHYQGREREWPVPVDDQGSAENRTALYSNTWSSGLILIDETFLTGETYDGLLALVDHRMYETHRTELTDQMIFNIFFSGQQHLVSAKYNYPLTHRVSIEKKEGLSPTEARALHFNGPVKPWNIERVLVASQRDPAYIKAAEFWYDCYIECLQNLYLRKEMSSRNGIESMSSN
ncbi:MAG: hypothetical protein HKN25_09780 [Pyrinomonadaceae bacterium]|nr:hypothetical protein [Pyrinomonadaceae bacterium]